MRKWIMCAFTVMLLSLTLSVTAFAAGGDSGVYDVKNSSGATLTPLTAANGDIQAGSANVDGSDVSGFYKNAARIKVDLSGAESGKEYLVIVTEGQNVTPDANNIVYIDQVTASGDSVSFNVYPRTLTSGKTYSVRISTNAANGALAEKGSFQYYAAYTLGDVNEDGEVTIMDAMAVVNHVVENSVLTGNKLLAANVDTSSASKDVNILDAMKIVNYVVENITSFE